METLKNKKTIKIKGARVHNLKNINVEIPRNKFVVITGLSGSGKSSLAFDTIYAEGQRRYIESLSSYARQFIGTIDKPDIDSIEGLSPAISIDQRTAPHNPRSTVGTITEIYDYFRLLFARIGVPYCYKCGEKMKQYTINKIIASASKKYLNKNIIILAPIICDKKGEYKKILNKIKNNYNKIIFNNKIYSTEEILNKNINNKNFIEIIINDIKLENNEESKACFTKAIKKALELGNKSVFISLKNNKEKTIYSELFICSKCGIRMPKIEPRNFSFNSPYGACEECSGLGSKFKIDPELIVNKNLTIAEGGIKILGYDFNGKNNKLFNELKEIAKKNKFNFNMPIKNLTDKQLKIIFYGEGLFTGIVPNFEKKYKETKSDYIKKEIEQYMRVLICPSCNGKKLKKESLSIKINGFSIDDIVSKTIIDAKKFFNEFEKEKNITTRAKEISKQIIKEIKSRLDFLLDVRLEYLTLNRSANTLSGGEAQRIRLANQIGTSLTNIIYVLDEPSIGLHQRDNSRLITALKKLKDKENTVIVVEHDEETINSADWIIDVGPGAGIHGGEIVASGDVDEIKKTKRSLTGQYLSKQKVILISKKNRNYKKQSIKIIGAKEHNLKNIDVEIPLGKFVAITGVSGSGKSTLMFDILVKTLNKKFYRAKAEPGKYFSIKGINFIDKVINIDQSPIGRTPRSNPATYTGAFTPIRELFADLPEAKIKGYKAGHFSFNVIGGRCEACSGDGYVKIEMQFLSDIYVKCEVCQGKRYNKEALEIYYKDKNIVDVLDMTIEEAMIFFNDIPAIYQKLLTLNQVGLGYVKAGQSATTLSGGEAQRVKLATELSRRSTGKTLYILDEPTTGLHFEDIQCLLKVLNKLVDKGNTVLVIEHNLDVIKSVDHIIDLGPEGGDKGGKIVAQGTPDEIIKIKNSWTGKFLKKII